MIAHQLLETDTATMILSCLHNSREVPNEGSLLAILAVAVGRGLAVRGSHINAPAQGQLYMAVVRRGRGFQSRGAVNVVLHLHRVEVVADFLLPDVPLSPELERNFDGQVRHDHGDEKLEKDEQVLDAHADQDLRGDAEVVREHKHLEDNHVRGVAEDGKRADNLEHGQPVERG